MKWNTILPDFISRHVDDLIRKVEGALVYFTPSYVRQNNRLFSPVIAVVAVIIAVISMGIAIGSFFSLFSSLLVLYFILTRVFGIRLDTGDIVVV